MLSLVAVVSCRRPLSFQLIACRRRCRHRRFLSAVDITTVRGSRRKPPQSSSPIRCLRCLSSLSFVAVVSRQRPPSFQFIACRRCRCLCRRRRRFLSAVDIIAIYCPPSPSLLSLGAPSLVSCRASSPPPSPASTLTSGKIGQQWMGGGVRLTAWRNRWMAVAAAAMGVGGHHDGRR